MSTWGETQSTALTLGQLGADPEPWEVTGKSSSDINGWGSYVVTKSLGIQAARGRVFAEVTVARSGAHTALSQEMPPWGLAPYSRNTADTGQEAGDSFISPAWRSGLSHSDNYTARG